MEKQQQKQKKFTTKHRATGVTLNNAKFRCTKCRKWKAASDFGNLRKMRDGTIRNQSQCIDCR